MLAINSELGIIVKVDADGNMTSVDTANGTIIVGKTAVVPAPPGVPNMNVVFGADGYLYTARDAAGSNSFSKWSKIDPTSLQIVGTVGDDDGPVDTPAYDGLYTCLLKNRGLTTTGQFGYPYLLGGAPISIAPGACIVSTGQLEALVAGTPTGGNLPMRFVGKTAAAPDPYCSDFEIDALSITEVNSPLPGFTFDLWGVDGTGRPVAAPFPGQ